MGLDTPPQVRQVLLGLLDHPGLQLPQVGAITPWIIKL